MPRDITNLYCSLCIRSEADISERFLSFIQIHICEEPFKKAWAAVYLPRSLRNYLGIQSLDPEHHSKIQFNFFGRTSLFVVNRVISYTSLVAFR